MGQYLQNVFILVLFIALNGSVWSAYPSSRNRNNPLMGEEIRKRSRASECHFGKTVRELGSTWVADLGPPFGLMYCIRCECVPVQKKRRIVARTQCRNIKHECPKPSCDDPVLHPGRCCKLCPGDVQEVAMDVPAAEEDKNVKHFGALLTPRSSLVFKRDDIVNIPSKSNKPAYQIVATGRFTYHKKNLYYSFYLANTLGEIPPRPRAIQFINYNGDLLLEQNIVSTPYQNATGKVCGAWSRLPRDYKRLLRGEALYVALLWGNDLALSGRVARFKTLYSEHFTALMTPPSSALVPPDGGGTAILSVSTTLARTNSIHMTLVFNGIFSPLDIHDVPLTVRLEGTEKFVYEEVIRVQKPSTELNVEEVQFSISAGDLPKLTRGKTSITISSTRHPDLMFIQGPILSKAACEIYQSPLSPSTDFDVPATPMRDEGTGLIWMYVTREGELVYNWQIEGLRGEPSVALVQRNKVIQTLNASTQLQSWGNGITDKFSPRNLDLLYTGELTVRAAGDKGIPLLRGTLLARPVAGAVDSANPVLLIPDVPSQSFGGLAWMSIDFDCDLHYEVQLVGGQDSRTYQLYLEDTPLIAPNAPISRRLLEDFNGTLLEGFAMLQTQELMRMDAGICFLEVVDLQTGRRLLRANMNKIKIPKECLSTGSDNEVPLQSYSIAHPPLENKCLHEGVFYDEGVQWQHRCRMCHCLRGKERCDDIICPQLNNCPKQAKVHNDSCCPSCSNESTEANTSRGCYLGGIFHTAGSSWHPYLPPHGFNLCTVVSCEADTLNIKMTRIHCPPLTCPEKDQIRSTKDACCKICPDQEREIANDQAVSKKKWRTDDDIMREGGCTYLGRGPYENNTDWSHTIPSVRPAPCIQCHCRNGAVTCEQKKCPRVHCSNTNPKQATSIMDECCISQCRRYRRQSKHRQKGTKKQ